MNFIMKLKETKSVEKMIDTIMDCLECSMNLAAEFSTILKLEWSIKSKLNNFSLVEKKMIRYITNRYQMKDCNLEKFTYWIDENKMPRLNLTHKKN